MRTRCAGSQPAQRGKCALASLNERYGTRKSFSADAMQQMLRHVWPGNARELRNAVSRAFLMAQGDLVTEVVEHTLARDPLQETPNSMTIAVGMTFEEIERRMLLKTLQFFGNDKLRAAEALGISVKTIYNRLARYQLKTEDAGDGSAIA